MKQHIRIIGSLLLAIGLGTLAGCGGGAGGTTAAAPVSFTNGQAAALVIGQPDFVSVAAVAAAPTQSGTGVLYGNPDVIGGVLYLGDFGNNRVLGFNAMPTTNGANADFVLGASDFVTNGTTLTYPTQVTDDGTSLFVFEYAYDIAVYTPIPTAATSAPTATMPPAPSFHITASTVGGFSGTATTVSIGGGKLVVADSSNNRVLIWNSIPTADTPPDLVLGQPDFATFTGNTVGLSAASMKSPEAVWTDGTRLVVDDSFNSRVLIWNTFPTSNDQPADLVLGQPDFVSNAANLGGTPTASTMFFPYGVFVSGNQLFVADYFNNRVLIWNSFPTVNDQPADAELGQPDFVSNSVNQGGTTPTASTLNHPRGLFLDGTQLIVADQDNVRYLVFNGQ